MLDNRTAVCTAVRKFTERGHEYVELVHAGTVGLSMTTNQFEKAIADVENVSDYMDIVVTTEMDNVSQPWASEELRDLLVKYEVIGGKAKVAEIAGYDAPF
jgi:hypothetical protein